MNLNAISDSLHTVDDPFDIYEAFVLHTQGSPKEQVQVWKRHLGVDAALDDYLNLTMRVREYCDNQRRNNEIDLEIDSLWNTIIDAAHGVVDAPTSIIDLT